MSQRWSRRSVVLLAPAVAAFAVSRGPGVATRPGGTPGATPLATPMRANRPASVTDKVTIALTDSGFRPDYVQATNGGDLHVTLRNTGTRDHAFQISKLGVDETLAPGDEQKVTIESPPLGDFTFTSDAPGDEDFEGTLVFYI